MGSCPPAKIPPPPPSLIPRHLSMETRSIDGIALSKRLRVELRGRSVALVERGIRPGLAAVGGGRQPAAKVYVRNKITACAEVGLYSEHVELPESIQEADLLARVAALNADPRIHGILVQLPLPRHISGEAVLAAILPA